MITKVAAITNFLRSSTHSDLADLYSEKMECQVLVATMGGTLVKGEFKGREFQKRTDGHNSWKSFRIPYDAKTNNPHWKDHPQTYDLSKYAEGIGMTGWDWKNQLSMWVGYDFDSITTHKTGISAEEMDKVLMAATKLDYITVRKSTSGSGYHLYVFLDPVKTLSHTEHSALARSILGKMCADTGFDFEGSIDCFGGNMWVWGRKMLKTDGLSLVKQGKKLYDIPLNWRDHLAVITNKSKKVKSTLLSKKQSKDEQDAFEKLLSQKVSTPLDDKHRAVIQYLNESGAFCQWINDLNILVTHTSDLKKIHKQYVLKGIYETVAVGKEETDHNCYMFPLQDGAWSVRRFTKGVQEAPSWMQDGQGWTQTYFNRAPDLATAARQHGGVEDTDGGFVFQEAELAIDAANAIGVSITLPVKYSSRESKLKIQAKTGRVIMKVKCENSDGPIPGWLRKKTHFQQILNTPQLPPAENDIVCSNDEGFRHCVNTDGQDGGWYIYSNTGWKYEPLTHIKAVLASLGYGPKEKDIVVGQHVQNHWTMVNKPFQPEYLGEREWNYKAAQLAYPLKESSENLNYPSWLKVLDHCGTGLNQAVLTNNWCQENGIQTGADYLKCWIASMFQVPSEPLPYLFLFGPENCGKSILHEALSLLMTKGAHRADTALRSTGDFNGELYNIVLAIVEEVNLGLRKNGSALSKMKDWVTSPKLSIHTKSKTPILVDNTLHFIQVANDITFVPVIPGDTRVVVIRVEPLKVIIPKREFLISLQLEASDFLTEVMQLKLPYSPDRLGIPIVSTIEKETLEQANMEDLDIFIQDHITPCPGKMTLTKDVFLVFQKNIEPDQLEYWTIRRFNKQMAKFSHLYPKGRRKKDNQHCFGNMSLESCEPEGKTLRREGDYLV